MDELKKFFSGLKETWTDLVDKHNKGARRIIDAVTDGVSKAYDKVQGVFSDGYNQFLDVFENGIDAWGDSSKDDYYDKKDDYLDSLKEVKTFDEWLEGLGLSADSKSENYYGKYVESGYSGAVNGAASAYNYASSKARSALSANNTYAENAYNRAISPYSGTSEALYAKGLKGSGYDGYLKANAYSAYRGEIAKNRSDYLNSLSNARYKYDSAVSAAEVSRANALNAKHSELLKLYLDELRADKNAINSVYD